MPEWMMLPEPLDPKVVLFFLLMAAIIFLANRGEATTSKPQRRHRTVAVARNRQR